MQIEKNIHIDYLHKIDMDRVFFLFLTESYTDDTY